MTDSPSPRERLYRHLRAELGAWPPRGPLTLATSPRREQPSWDGGVRPFMGVSTPDGSVLSVPAALLPEAELLRPLWGSGSFATELAALLGLEDPASRVLDASAFYRWSEEPADLPPEGEWVDRDDPRLPEWLRPFNGGILCAWDDEGRYGAGVGLKHHDEHCQEIAVGTEPALRGQGWARRLVVTAARAVLDRGAVPTYLHVADNHASAHVAEASGFPDRGWRAVGLSERQGP